MNIVAVKKELRAAKRICGENISELFSEQLRFLVANYGFSIRDGDLQIVQDHWYVTHKGLLGLANRRYCCGIHSEPIPAFCNPSSSRWVFKAVVYTSAKCKGFVGYGDAHPSNVSPLVHGAEMRVAETRAVNRALRKAYGIGICSFEELGMRDSTRELLSDAQKRPSQSANSNRWATGPRVRDRLCQLIRKHELDPDLVKAYATDFCGVKTLREANREQVEAFVQSLADWAEKDRNALLCQLNGYLPAKENVDQKDGVA